MVTLFASCWCFKFTPAFESVRMLNLKSISDRSGFQLACRIPNHMHCYTATVLSIICLFLTVYGNKWKTDFYLFYSLPFMMLIECGFLVVNYVVYLMQRLLSSATGCHHSFHSWLSRVTTHKQNSVWPSTTLFRHVYFSSLSPTHSARRTRTWLGWFRSAMRSFLWWFCATNPSSQCVLLQKPFQQQFHFSAFLYSLSNSLHQVHGVVYTFLSAKLL